MNSWVAELPWLYTALFAYGLATAATMWGGLRVRGGAAGAAMVRTHEPYVLVLIASGVLLLGRRRCHI